LLAVEVEAAVLVLLDISVSGVIRFGAGREAWRRIDQ
jgi:hypothetical protein